MPAFDSKARDTRQPPECDTLTQCADALEDADFANGFAPPSEEDDFSGEPPSRLDVLYSRYLYALRERDDSEPIPAIDLETAWDNLCRAKIDTQPEHYQTRRRHAAAMARFWRALHVWMTIRKEDKKEYAKKKRANNKQELDYWSKRLAM
jgi:hypothetical protein